MTNLQKFINEYNLTTKVDELNFRNDTFDRIVQCVLKLISEDGVKQFSIENITYYLKCIMEIVEMTADVQGHIKKILTMELMRDIITSVNGNTTVMLDVIVEKAMPGIIDVIIDSSKSTKLQAAKTVARESKLKKRLMKILACGKMPSRKNVVVKKELTEKQVKKHEEQMEKKEMAEKKREEILALQNEAKEKAKEAELAAKKVAEASKK